MVTEERSREKPRISFITTCMNRLHHLKETLPKNIANNISYGNVEFVLLNYNSQDGIDHWVKKEMWKFVDKGILIYLTATQPEFWNPSHARNMVFKYASGEILCNIDSDHFTGRDYAYYVNECFQQDQEIFLSGRAPGAKLDMMGRFCVWKKDFLHLRGYDESFAGYGFEDQDIYDRLKLIGRRERSIDLKYLETISHSHADRVKDTIFMRHIKHILISESYPSTKALIIKNDNTYELFALVALNGMVSIDETSIEAGEWREEASSMRFISETHQTYNLKPNAAGGGYLFNNSEYRMINDNIDALYYYSLLFNQRAYKKNILTKRIAVNPTGYGEGTVYLNMDFKQPISVRRQIN